ncbi:DUF6270 domain-containing protein [Neomicrococcus lactis]|uniref:Uncharacterized protein n=1 Tax=Neomicrococcus lactis TaxID=732241 RepID=A0A7W9DAX6_9MICC|nr:DUF6270 domain-containing protein [Neomicrococcus lactis]MBB5597501.1 hypothetical protein [Neomicrococcus lactis]
MTTFASNDYEVWDQPIFDWASADAFDDASVIQNGIHRIGIGGGPSLDYLVSVSPETDENGPLLVFFNAAIANRDQKTPPFFSGKVLANRLNMDFLSISDPSTSLDDSLGLAWYTGNQYGNVVGALEQSLKTIAHRFGRRLLLIGGSGGGFAAIHLGGLLGELATVIAWNPQTDIFEYNADFVQRYLGIAFPEELGDSLDQSEWKVEAKERLNRRGVQTNLLSVSSKPMQAIIFQNSSDWHVAAHLAPLIESWGMENLGRGLYRTAPDVIALIANFGEGHAALPAELLIPAIHALSGSNTSVMDVFKSQEVVTKLSVADTRLLPRDLRGISDAISEDMSLELQFLPTGILKVEALHRHSPQGIGRMRYRYFTESQTGERTYRANSFAASANIKVDGTDVCAGVELSDGFQHHLIELSSEIPWARQQVFILGSCVSRDSFEDPRAPKLAGYVARTSLASAFAEHPHIAVDLLQNPSPFQRRMVQTDINKELKDRLQSTHFDLLLVDLIDERLGLMNDAGGYYTDSPELRACKFIPSRENNIPLGSQEYYDAFDRGLGQLLKAVPSTKIVVNEAYWAAVDTVNQSVADPEVVEFNNGVLKVLYDKLRAIPGVRFISHEAEVMRADPSHKWGVSPFHFGKDFESSLIAGLRTMSIS